MVDELAKIICFNIDMLSSCDDPCITCSRQAEAAIKFIENCKNAERKKNVIKITRMDTRTDHGSEEGVP